MSGPAALQEWGWDDSFAALHREAGDDDCFPGRVIGGGREHFRVIAAGGEAWAAPSGKLRRGRHAGVLWPAVGDWVLLSGAMPAQGSDGLPGTGASELKIVHVLPRRTWISRRAPDARGGGEQVLAANVDIAFIVTSLNRDLNPRRLERYLAMIVQGGVKPVLVYSKADLAPGMARTEAETAALAPGVPALAISALTGAGVAALARYLAPARTVVLVGSSGVGKSTLANALLGRAAQAVREIRAGDDRGRHSTTSREMFRLPGGALLIDTPGLRELGLADADGALDAVFAELSALASGCRFADCRHDQEPGCAVKAAVESGTLDPGRYAGYVKLKREATVRAAEADPAEARKRKAKDKSLAKLAKQMQKQK